ncbi:hypothetical protein [Arsenicicoccus dermatophilus]
MPEQATATIEVPAHELAQMEHRLEELEEAAADAERSLRVDEQGWSLLSGGPGDRAPITREKLLDRAALARVMAVADPLIRRAVTLRAAYVWGAGPTIAADDPDVDDVVQMFLTDQEATYSGAQAREARERAFATDGTYCVALPTNPADGRVQARRVPVADIIQVISNPDDRDDPWFYKRRVTSSRMTLTPGRDTVTATTRDTVTHVWHPALGVTYSRSKPTSIDGDHIDWDTPILMAKVNQVDGLDYGLPDTYAALSWAQGYRDFLTDWAKLVKALSKFAFQATSKGSKAGQTRAALAPATVEGAPVGQTMITSEGQRFEAIGKSGATIDSNSGRPLAAMVAAALDVPVTMLLADPGVTGARATAETLDRPLEEVLGRRRELHASIDRRVLDWAVQSSMRAPGGALRGTPTVDPVTGRERYVLTGDVSDAIDVDFPPISKPDLAVLMQAINTADATGKLPPLEITKLLIRALEIDGGEEIIDDITDENGDWVDPVDSARARSQTQGVYQGLAPGQTPDLQQQDV